MIDVRRAADRYVDDVDGVISRHCFASGAHYDPDNVSFGPVIACDEHVVAPGAGFSAHRHVSVELISWVLGGALRHTDDAGRVHDVVPGVVQYQRAGAAITHAEMNASDVEPLHFVQLWLLCEDATSDYAVTAPPVELRTGRFDVVTGPTRIDGWAFAFVARGGFLVGSTAVTAGDSVLLAAGRHDVTGSGELLVVHRG